jgi:hypothetical protein
MDRRTRVGFVGILVALVAVVGGIALFLPGTVNQRHGPVAPDPMVGVIVAVDAEGLGSVGGFTLRRTGGDLVVFDLRALENGFAFPPGHLAEHQATAEPVRVWYRDDAGTLLAIRIEDAASQ